MKTLAELAVNHSYYCSDSNYYSNEGAMRFPTMTDFLDDFEDADIDYNLCFRWDIREATDDEDEPMPGWYQAEVFLMLQRKGIFRPCSIARITEDEVERFVAYAQKHLEYLQGIWAPLWVTP